MKAQDRTNQKDRKQQRIYGRRLKDIRELRKFSELNKEQMKNLNGAFTGTIAANPRIDDLP